MFKRSFKNFVQILQFMEFAILQEKRGIGLRGIHFNQKKFIRQSRVSMHPKVFNEPKIEFFLQTLVDNIICSISDCVCSVDCNHLEKVATSSSNCKLWRSSHTNFGDSISSRLYLHNQQIYQGQSWSCIIHRNAYRNGF